MSVRSGPKGFQQVSQGLGNLIEGIGACESGDDAAMFFVQSRVDEGLDVEFPSQGSIAEQLRLLLGGFGFEQGGETPYGFFDAVIGRS